MLRPAIVHIVNFIRAEDTRDPEHDMLDTLSRQIDLVQGLGLPATWPIQYDALVDDRYVTLLKDRLDKRQEIGVWFEIPQAQCEAAGIEWRGRQSWDWAPDVAFPTGYSPAEREKLADVCMETFRDTFGAYPRSVGAWYIDAHTLAYLADHYGIVASCNCKDQWGTDAYTFWGGYYGQAYYPSRRNAFMPAQTQEEQIPVPIFRMLGSDPIYQYDIDSTENGQMVLGLEPIYGNAGASPEWVRWFFDAHFNAPRLAFGYAQVGQENSFRWELMEEGLRDQLELIAENVAEKKWSAETLSQTGAWYRSRYAVTPASAITALKDWKEDGCRSVWYDSRFYRVNLYWEDGRFWLRDLHRFDETYAERHLVAAAPEGGFVADTLPAMDGYRWSGKDCRAGIYATCIRDDGVLVDLNGGDPEVEEILPGSLNVRWPLEGGGILEVVCQPEEILVRCTQPGWRLAMRWDAACDITETEAAALHFEHCGFAYQVALRDGSATRREGEHSIEIAPGEDGIALRMDA